jgi:hypothetical protein
MATPLETWQALQLSPAMVATHLAMVCKPLRLSLWHRMPQLAVAAAAGSNNANVLEQTGQWCWMG